MYPTENLLEAFLILDIISPRYVPLYATDVVKCRLECVEICYILIYLNTSKTYVDRIWMGLENLKSHVTCANMHNLNASGFFDTGSPLTSMQIIFLELLMMCQAALSPGGG